MVGQWPRDTARAELTPSVYNDLISISPEHLPDSEDNLELFLAPTLDAAASRLLGALPPSFTGAVILAGKDTRFYSTPGHKVSKASDLATHLWVDAVETPAGLSVRRVPQETIEEVLNLRSPESTARQASSKDTSKAT